MVGTVSDLFWCIVFFYKDGRSLNRRKKQEVLKVITPRNMERDQELEDNKELLLMTLRIMVACVVIA